MKKISFLILMVLLLVSCGKDRTVLVLASSSGIEAHIAGGRENATVELDEGLVASLLEVSGKDPETLAKELFGGNVTVAEGDDYLYRERVYRALEENTGTGSKTEVLLKERKRLSSSSFFTSMGKLAGGYDKDLLAMVKKNRKGYVLYDGAMAVGEKVEGEEELHFLKSWIKAIIS